MRELLQAAEAAEAAAEAAARQEERGAVREPAEAGVPGRARECRAARLAVEAPPLGRGERPWSSAARQGDRQTPVASLRSMRTATPPPLRPARPRCAEHDQSKLWHPWRSTPLIVVVAVVPPRSRPPTPSRRTRHHRPHRAGSCHCVSTDCGGAALPGWLSGGARIPEAALKRKVGHKLMVALGGWCRVGARYVRAMRSARCGGLSRVRRRLHGTSRYTPFVSANLAATKVAEVLPASALQRLCR